MKTVDCREVYTHSLKEELDQLTKAEFSRYFRKHQRRREPRLLPIRYGAYFRDVVMPEWEGRLEGEGYLTWPLAQRVFNSMALEAAERQGGGNMEDLEKFLGERGQSK